MLILALLACSSDETTDSSAAVAGGCYSGPTITITSPASSAKLPAGAAVTLSMDLKLETDDPSPRLLWAIMPNGGSDVVHMGTHTTETWTPSADDVGIWTIFASAEDTCTDELSLDQAQETVRVEVIE